MSLRNIEPINIADLDTAAPEAGEPICERVDPKTLFVDPAYQRSIGERGLRQIRRIVEAFCWTKFKPPICAYAEHDGKTVLKVLDGQHTAIAAASHPDIAMIPVMIVEAAETAAQAAAFVGQNTERLGVTALQVHQAAVVAQDDDALTIQQVCEAAGVKVLANPPSRNVYGRRETVAIAAIGKLIERNGPDVATAVLTILANADLAPIAANHIAAAEILKTDPEYRDQFDDVALTDAIVGLGKAAEHEAKLMVISHKVPMKKALAIQWFRKTKKRRAPVTPQTAVTPAQKPKGIPSDLTDMLRPEIAARAAQVAARTVVPHSLPTQRNVTASILGDPAPGRSALDQRKATA